MNEKNTDNSYNIVTKSNLLNSFKCSPHSAMSLNELRFFCLYISKLNPKLPVDIKGNEVPIDWFYQFERRRVSISVSEFEEIFNIKVNSTGFAKTLKQIIGRSIEIYDENKKEYKLISVYGAFGWKEGFENKVIDVYANIELIPHLWGLKKNYTKYRLINIAKLDTVSSIRLYEILCQYAKIGERTIEIEELQQFLMVEYKEFRDFQRYTLVPAVKSVNEHTNLMISYEKVTKSRKCVAIHFKIETKETEETTENAIETTEKATENTKEITKEPRKKGKTIENPDIDRAKLREMAENLLDDDYGDSQIERFIDYCIEKSAIDSEVRNPTKYVMKVMSSCSGEWQSKHQATSYDISDVEKYAVNYEAFVRENKGITEPTTEIKVTTPTEPVKAITEPTIDEGERIYKEFIKDGYAEMLQMSFAEANIRLLMINPVWETIDSPHIEATKKILDHLKSRENQK